MTNHIIVGLGGTGGRIIRSFRKTVFMEHRNVEPCRWDPAQDKFLPPVAKISYLYADSNNHDIDGQRDLWRVLGQSIALDEDSVIRIRNADLLAIFDGSCRNPGVSPWIGDEKVLREMVSNAAGAPGANQIRRLGRFLFAASAGQYTRAITSKVAQLIQGASAEVSFHICCTLAAGTGSGSIVDSIVQIRKIYRNPDTHPIFVYALITDQPQTADTGNFYANQYAALAELNALRLGLFKPYDVTAERPQRLDNLRDPFQSCLLLSGINEQNDTATREDQEQMIADLLYQKIVALKGKIPDRMMKAETAEDLRVAYPHELNERGYFASTLGLKRFVVPETEIREKLLFSFALQAARQFQFSNLSEDSGFLAQARTRDLPELVTKAAQNERWYLTDNHLKLSTDFRLAGGTAWLPIAEDWNTALEAEKADIMANNPKADEQWVPLITEFAENYFKHLFREVGVVQYYDHKRRARPDYAKEIRNRIEADLFERWYSGEDGVEDSVRLAKALNEHLDEQERGKQLDGQIAAQKAAIAKLEEEEARIRQTWEKIGIGARLCGKHKKVFESLVENTKALYISRTEVAALAFAKELLAQVRIELRELQNRLGECQEAISEANADIEKEDSARCQSAEKVNYRSKTVRLIDQEAVENTIKHLTVDKSTQKAQAQAARDRICRELGLEKNFRTFAEKLNAASIKDLLVCVCGETSSTAHESLFAGQTSDFQRIVGVNIVERLFSQYGGMTEKLNDAVRELVLSAAPYMTFDSNAAQPRVLLQDPAVPEMPRPSWTVFLPVCPNLEHKFRGKLKEAFVNAGPTGMVHVEDSTHNPNEITIITFKYWFAFRFMKPLHELRKKYEAKMVAAEVRAVHQVHLENHRCEVDNLAHGRGIAQLPGLMLPDVGKKGFALLIIGEAIGLVTSMTDPQTGQASLYLAERDADGMALSEPANLGADTLPEASARLDERTFARLRQLVGEMIARNFRHMDRRAELAAKLDAVKRQRFQEYGRNDFNQDFREWARGVDDAKAAINTLMA